MDPYICCLIGLCCPPESQEQIDTLAKMLLERGVCDDITCAERVAKFHVDLVRGFVDNAKGKKK